MLPLFNFKEENKMTKNIKKVFLELIEANKDDNDMLDIIADMMNSFSNYVASVYKMETLIPIIRFKYEGDDQQDRIMKLDTARKFAHENAINACNILNRMVKAAGIEEPFYDGNIKDRYEVADFCIEVTKEFFNDGVEAARAHNIKEYVDAASM